MADLITFGSATLGYWLVAINVILHVTGRPRRALLVLMAAVILFHVALVWTLRFEWSIDYAWDKSPAGFLVFHTAFALLQVAALVKQPWSGRLLLAALPIVSVGALGAAFRYEYLAAYRAPLLIAFAMAVGFVSVKWIRRANDARLLGDTPPDGPPKLD